MTRRVLTRLLVLCLVAVCSIYFIASRGLHQGLDLKGGVQIGLRVLTDDALKGDAKLLLPMEQRELRENATLQTMRVIENRLNGLGVGEITIQRTDPSTNYALKVQVPGAEDPNRVKELIQATAELAAGKSASAAITAGFQRVFRTLIDTHLAAMVSAVILFMFGSGAGRGFPYRSGQKEYCSC